MSEHPSGATTIDEVNGRFEQTPIEERIFINSVPKCGTMLLRNIIYTFVPRSQWYTPFIVDHEMEAHRDAARQPELACFTGHLNHWPFTISFMRGLRHVLIVRDPYDYCLSCAYYMCSESLYEREPLTRLVRDQALDFEDVVRLVIRGFAIPGKVHQASVKALFVDNALSWLGGDCLLVRYEELVGHLRDLGTPQAEAYFLGMLKHLRIDPPEDWRERVAAGSSREVSSTASEQLECGFDRPKKLSEQARRLFDVCAPGLREALGYR